MAAGEGNPLISQIMGCHPSQSKEFNEEYKKHGITGAYHREDGALVITSNKARNQVMKSRNYLDRDAGYGQWAGK